MIIIVYPTCSKIGLNSGWWFSIYVYHSYAMYTVSYHNMTKWQNRPLFKHLTARFEKNIKQIYVRSNKFTERTCKSLKNPMFPHMKRL